MLKDLKKNIKVVKYVFKFCPGYVIFSIFNIIIGAILALSRVYIIKDVVTLVTNSAMFSEVLKELLIYIAILIVGMVYQTIYGAYITRVYSVIFVNKMQNYLYSRVKRVDYADFDNPEFYDSYSRALRDGTRRGITVYENFVNLFGGLVNSLTLGAFIMLNDIWLIVITLLSVATTLLVTIKTDKLWHKLELDVENSRRMYFYVNRVFYQQKFAAEIKTTSISDLLIERYNDSYVDINDKYIKMQRKILGWNTIKNSITAILDRAGTYIYLGIKLFITHVITVDLFTSIINSVSQFRDNFIRMANAINRIKANALYIDDFLDYINYKPSLETLGTKELKEEFEYLDIKDVNFTYPGNDHQSITDLSLRIEKNEKLAIVGLNGAGKTTLIKLLLKFYNPNNGSINYNGIDIRDVKEEDIRNKYSIVFQDFQIYAVSIAENILMRKYEDGDEERVWEALRAVDLEKKIRSLPDGIHTCVTREFERSGMVFSGGEKQRLVIARILLSDAKIDILDEPTASLDPIAERNINNLLLEKCKDKTIIIIAHRLSTVVDADRIILIENGSIVESGTHDELMAEKKKYYEMFSSQASLYQSHHHQLPQKRHNYEALDFD